MPLCLGINTDLLCMWPKHTGGGGLEFWSPLTYSSSKSKIKSKSPHLCALPCCSSKIILVLHYSLKAGRLPTCWHAELTKTLKKGSSATKYVWCDMNSSMHHTQSLPPHPYLACLSPKFSCTKPYTRFGPTIAVSWRRNSSIHQWCHSPLTYSLLGTYFQST